MVWNLHHVVTCTCNVVCGKIRIMAICSSRLSKDHGAASIWVDDDYWGVHSSKSKRRPGNASLSMPLRRERNDQNVRNKIEKVAFLLCGDVVAE